MFVTPAEFTVPVRGDLELLEVPRATVTTFGKGRLRVAWGQPSRFVTGAVHDDGGVLVPASQRVGGLHYDHAVAADPGSLPPWAGRTEELAGTWLFGGTWFNHFGHFLTETLTTLWHREAVDGILFVPFWFGREVLDWQTELLALAGRREPVRVVGAERVRVERLLVPERPVIPNGHVRPEAYDVWRSVASAARSAGSPERVFLSRSRHHRAVEPGSRAARRVADNEVELDTLMSRLGFVVVHAEELSVAEQVEAVAAARVLVGVSGSALHLSVFAPERASVVELGDPRRAEGPVLTQQLLCRGADQPLAYVRFPAHGRAYDLELVRSLLQEHRLVG